MSIIQQLEHEGVSGIRVGRFKAMINTSVIVYRVGDTLIDCGSPNQWRFVKRFMEKHRIARVLVTHHHEDHSGNGAFIRDELSLPVLAPQKSLKSLAEGYPIHLYRRIIWGMPRNYRAEPIPEIVELGNTLTLHVLPAPGHSPDMNCFWVPERGWLFTADLYISSYPQYSRKEDSTAGEIESLRRMLSYDFKTVFCAHRGIVKNGREAIREKLDYLESLRQEIQRLYGEGKSIKEIRDALLGKEKSVSWISFFHFSKKNMILSLLNEKEAKE